MSSKPKTKAVEKEPEKIEETKVEVEKEPEKTPSTDSVDAKVDEPAVAEQPVKEKIDPMVQYMLDMRARQREKEANKQAGIYSIMAKFIKQ